MEATATQQGIVDPAAKAELGAKTRSRKQADPLFAVLVGSRAIEFLLRFGDEGSAPALAPERLWLGLGLIGGIGLLLGMAWQIAGYRVALRTGETR